MRMLLLAGLIAVLAGCASLPTATLRQAGASAYDEGMEGAIQFICNDASIGAVKRRFGVSRETMDRWLAFCYGDNALFSLPAAAPASEATQPWPIFIPDIGEEHTP